LGGASINSVLATYGETTVLCTVVAAKKASPNIDFFPLTVNYQEKTFAAGRIPGGFQKREGRPSENETLTSRLIDRPIRPLFVDGFYNETQVVCTVLNYDRVNSPDIVAMIGASAALTLSGLPFLGPIACARVGYVDGQFVLNPLRDRMSVTDLDLIVAGTQEGVLMVESEAKELSEETMLQAVMFGFNEFQPVIQAIIALAETCAKEAWVFDDHQDTKKGLLKKIKALAEADLQEAYAEPLKKARYKKIGLIRDHVMKIAEENGDNLTLAGLVFQEVESTLVRGQTLKTKKRIDGRGLSDIRPIIAEAGVLSRVHGSSLFTRGETQALAVTTLGTSGDEQLIDALEGEYKESFMLHYNFPPYSVGEVGRLGAPGRREIGHGALARRALRAVVPAKDKFPYTLRIVSEVTESNGSSSMATVCAGILSLMDAGVPISKPVAGIAMGLIKEGKDYAVLSDILGDEDHLGDMDFKVAGTEHGVTALQMDLKITSINEEIMSDALKQAKEGRMHILGEMMKALSTSRSTLSHYAPQMVTFNVPKDKIRSIIGSGGSVIRDIIEKTGVKIDIEDDGSVRVAAVDVESSNKAIAMIRDIIAEPELGETYYSTVAKIVDFGVFVRYLGTNEGLVHVSELGVAKGDNVSAHYKVGDKLTVKIVGFERGKPRFKLIRETEGAAAVSSVIESPTAASTPSACEVPAASKSESEA
jgi:polyribonucleotide nucleotidyltransferase